MKPSYPGRIKARRMVGVNGALTISAAPLAVCCLALPRRLDWRNRGDHGRSASMNQRPEPRAGGVILALAILAGALIGVACRQASIGVVAGTGIGIVAALIIWLRDRRR
jgi:UDP-N-acetylmuramyl pentapeptide phosphotransferase/UDP-N-acetylglucosamine-1-phosphate transferase